ncbi:hypothetical protein BSK56_24180, partial [Paenibacillus borealis]
LNWSGPDNLFGYTSLGYDYYSGYSHAQARDFDSSIGRFMSEDTYEGELNDPLSLNLYTYVSNNPLRYTDPSGNYFCEEGDKGQCVNPSKQKDKNIIITKVQLTLIFTEAGHFQKNKVTSDMVNTLNEVLEKYEINTTLRVRNFLAVITHESLMALTEAGWLSEKSVRKYTERYDPGTKSGKDLGNTKTGDGYLFRGAGYIQLTGRSNYQAFADTMGDKEIMKQGAGYLAEKYAWEAAGNFWKNKGINKIISKGETSKQDEIETFKQVSNAVNRGNAYSKKDPINWEDRRKEYEIVRRIIK